MSVRKTLNTTQTKRRNALWHPQSNLAMNISTCRSRSCKNPPPTHAAASMNTAFRSWLPPSRRKGSCSLCLSALSRMKSTRSLPEHGGYARPSSPPWKRFRFASSNSRTPLALKPSWSKTSSAKGVHPLEEAFAFHALLHTEGLQYDINSLAAKAGKNPAFVATRLRLIELNPSIAEAFLADQIGVGHALEIAKLPQPEQQRAFEAAFHTVWSGGKETRILRPVRDLTLWIEQNILLSLDSVPFDKNDNGLVPEAGSCTNCPKRTGYNTLLFDAALRDSCTDGACYRNKLAKHVERQIAEKPKLTQITTEWKAPGNSAVLGRNQYVALDLPAKSAKSKKPLSAYQKPCKHMSEAIVVDGTERGRIARICAEPTCPVHFADRALPARSRQPKNASNDARSWSGRSSKPRCGTAHWPKCSSVLPHRSDVPTWRWLQVLF